VPVSPAVFVADHLRPAAIKAGVRIEPGQRFGLHNLRHSLSSWLVNKAQDRAEHPALYTDSDDAGSLYARRR